MSESSERKVVNETFDNRMEQAIARTEKLVRELFPACDGDPIYARVCMKELGRLLTKRYTRR
ncbi:MAG: hypothetical protein WC369_07190 [Dehalococcoidales bacterium]|jgi:hypothetical protein